MSKLQSQLDIKSMKDLRFNMDALEVDDRYATVLHLLFLSIRVTRRPTSFLRTGVCKGRSGIYRQSELWSSGYR
jgi:hypothetical protein